MLQEPGGHAILVGVGGLGKHSLAKLALHLAKLSLVTLDMREGYGLSNFKADLQVRKLSQDPWCPHATLNALL